LYIRATGSDSMDWSNGSDCLYQAESSHYPSITTFVGIESLFENFSFKFVNQ
jgi:hypothetical protein